MTAKTLDEQIHEAAVDARAARDRLNALQERYGREVQEPNMRNLIGQEFKYRNSYSCPSRADGYWWTYARIVGVRDVHYRVLHFQIDKYGKLEISEDSRATLEGYQPVTKREFLDAVLPMLEMVKKEVEHNEQQASQDEDHRDVPK